MEVIVIVIILLSVLFIGFGVCGLVYRAGYYKGRLSILYEYEKELDILIEKARKDKESYERQIDHLQEVMYGVMSDFNTENEKVY